MRWLASVLGMTVALGGCLGGDDPGTGLSGEDEGPPGVEWLPGRTIPWGITACRTAVAVIPTDQASLRPYLPDGFRSISLQELTPLGMSAPNPRDDANFGIEMQVCQEGVGLNGTVPSLVYGSYFTAVEPDPEYLREGVTYHFVKWDVLVPDEDRRELLRGYGVPAVNGSAGFTRFEQNGDRVLYDGTLDLNGTGSHRFQGTAAVPQGPLTFVEFTATPHGMVNWTAEVSPAGLGIGPVVVTVAPGTFAAQVLGAGPHEGAAYGGTFSFVNAAIELPPRPA